MECGKHRRLSTYMGVRFEFIKEIEFLCTESFEEYAFYGLPYRRIVRGRYPSQPYNYNDLRYATLIKTTRQSMLESRNYYSVLIF